MTATFQRATDGRISDYCKMAVRYRMHWRHIIFSTTSKERLKHVVRALKLLNSAAMSIKWKKCSVFSETIDYFGHVNATGILHITTKTTEAAGVLRCPSTVLEVRTFLGLDIFYRLFVSNLAKLASPWNKNLWRREPLQSSFVEEVMEVVDVLKEKLITLPVLAALNSNVQYAIDAETYDSQTECILL